MSAQEMTLAEWQAEGVRRFGPDVTQWRFVCPVCGHVATPADWHAAGAPEGAVAFSCVGRFLPGEAREALPLRKPSGRQRWRPCNYAGGGLFKLNPVRVRHPDHEEPHQLFAFAEPEGGA